MFLTVIMLVSPHVERRGDRMLYYIIDLRLLARLSYASTPGSWTPAAGVPPPSTASPQKPWPQRGVSGRLAPQCGIRRYQLVRPP